MGRETVREEVRRWEAVMNTCAGQSTGLVLVQFHSWNPGSKHVLPPAQLPVHFIKPPVGRQKDLARSRSCGLPFSVKWPFLLLKRQANSQPWLVWASANCTLYTINYYCFRQCKHGTVTHSSEREREREREWERSSQLEE